MNTVLSIETELPRSLVLDPPLTDAEFVYEPGAEAAAESGNAVRGTGPVEGFTLDLEDLWGCYEI